MRQGRSHWYAFQPQWDSFLAEGGQAFFVLGCMDLDTSFALPHKTIKAILPHLNTTTKEETYWHVHLVQQGGGLAISLPKEGSSLPLAEYALSLT